MNEHYIAAQSPEMNVIKFPLRRTEQEDDVPRSDAYSDLGGGVPPFREVEVLRIRPRETFFDIYDRTHESTQDNAHEPEVKRTYDLSLNGVLNSRHLEQLTKKELSVVATAVCDL